MISKEFQLHKLLSKQTFKKQAYKYRGMESKKKQDSIRDTQTREESFGKLCYILASRELCRKTAMYAVWTRVFVIVMSPNTQAACLKLQRYPSSVLEMKDPLKKIRQKANVCFKFLTFFKSQMKCFYGRITILTASARPLWRPKVSTFNNLQQGPGHFSKFKCLIGIFCSLTTYYIGKKLPKIRKNMAKHFPY